MDDPGDRIVGGGETRPDLASKDEVVTNRMQSPDATNLEKVLMAISGAAEGLAEQLRTSRLPELATEAVQKTTGTVTAAKEGFREGYPVSEGASATATASTTTTTSQTSTTGYTYPTTPKPGFGDTLAKASDKVSSMAQGISEATSRAAQAPTAITYEVKVAAKDVVKEAKGVAVGYVLAGVLGIFALAFFSVLIGNWLNHVLGGQWGTFLVGLVYLIGAVVAFSYAKRHLDGTKARARSGISDVKREVRSESQSIKRSFREGMGGGRPGA
ncbi:MAG TPA: phage holin family protein [Candidatus Thermoplasmatota archaeon]|nr:phage holin family protein [Candidatus Thermoplasmatota archaeon]